MHPPVDRDNRGHDIATNQVDRTEVAEQVDDGIPAWVIAASKTMSREVTPPEHLFFRDQGERQDEDCGPAAVIGTLYYIYCKTGIKRATLKSLLTFSDIRRYATSHLQQQTLLDAA